MGGVEGERRDKASEAQRGRGVCGEGGAAADALGHGRLSPRPPVKLWARALGERRDQPLTGR